MNYQDYLIRTYRDDFEDINSDEALAFMDDGSILTIPAPTSDTQYYLNYFENYLYYASNWVNRNKENGTYPLFVHRCAETSNGITYSYLFVTTNVEYLVFTSTGGGTRGITAWRGHDGMNSDIYEDSEASNYPKYTDNNTFSSYTYGYFQKSITNQSVIFDYTNLHYTNNSYYNDVLTVRGENLTFYKTYFTVSAQNGGYFDIGYGAPTLSVYQNSYQTGYGNGYNNGHTQGFDEGYQVGLNTNSGISQEPATAFSYIGQAFNAVGGIMNIEVLPHITLGTCFSIPLIFVLILTIFKLVRK